MRASSLLASPPSLLPCSPHPRDKQQVVYGALPKETVRALFDGYRAAQGRNYSSPAELERRFGVFKTNLAFIDRLNAHNPHAIFGLTRFVDRTEEEVRQLRAVFCLTTRPVELRAHPLGRRRKNDCVRRRSARACA